MKLWKTASQHVVDSAPIGMPVEACQAVVASAGGCETTDRLEDEERVVDTEAGTTPVAGQTINTDAVNAVDVITDDQHGEDDDDLLEADLTKLRKRRKTAGADTSHEDFSKQFDEWDGATESDIQQYDRGYPDGAVDESTHSSIVATVKDLLQKAADRQAAWEEDVPRWTDKTNRLFAAALVLYRTRLVDMYIREQVLILWLIDGVARLRVHSGICYTYNESGSFDAYKGLPTEHIFFRIKDFLLILEGLFRQLPRDLTRTDDHIWDAMYAQVTDAESESAWYLKCKDAAIFSAGSRRGGRAAGGKGDAFEAAAPIVPWNIFTAESISVVALKMQTSLLDGKLITYLVEWCETESMRQPGVAYTGVSVRYDVGDQYVTMAPPSMENNIYVRVPHPLRDPVAGEAKATLRTFLKQTFWCNRMAYNCMCAAQALAKRGLNIDRCFIGLSPGGVGQSLYSMLLANVYKTVHSYFDPNIWYLDEELRKQVESFVGCMILTGQECPETTRRMREDLYKKTMSADGISGRKPYGITTKMFELVGWKRIELNRMMRFQGVTCANFMSILRRSFVWTPKARFLDEEYLTNHYQDAAQDGIFPKNAQLRSLLQSGAAACTFLSLQHGFEKKHSRAQCEAMIEEWVINGADDHLTERTMRMACGLPKLKINAAQSAKEAQTPKSVPLQALLESPPDVEADTHTHTPGQCIV